MYCGNCGSEATVALCASCGKKMNSENELPRKNKLEESTEHGLARARGYFLKNGRHPILLLWA